MKRLYFLAILLCLYGDVFAQTVTVQNEENGQPLEGVTISSTSPPATITTDESGKADISVLQGAGKIDVTLPGFMTRSASYYDLEQTGFTVHLRPVGISLDQVVLSATRWQQPRREVPAHISYITPREVALQNPQTAADMLGLSGEVFIQKSQMGGGSPMIRGFATNRLLMTVDGVRMNSAILRGGNIQNVISLDAFSLEGTEVFFGPGSIIYGSDAIGGVMSFHTLTPEFSSTKDVLTKGNAVARYSSASEEMTGHFDINLGWRRFASVTSFTFSRFGDLRMGSHGPDEYLRPVYGVRQDSVDVAVTNEDPLVQRPTGYSQMNMMQKFRYKPSDYWDINYGFHYSITSNYSRYDRHIRYRNGIPRSAEWYYGPQEWMMNNLSIEYSKANGVFDQVTLRLAHQFFEESRIDRDWNDDERRNRTEKVNALSANLDFHKSLGKGKLFYGAELVHNDVQSIGTDEDISTGIKVPGPTRYPQADWASYAAYVTYQHRLSEKVLVQGGARYNQFLLDARFDTTFYPFPYTSAKMNNGAVTGSLGLVANPSQKTTVHFNLSSGFRSPNVDDAGKVFDSEPGTVIVPNPELNAEYAYNAELGLARVFGEIFRIDATAYYTILENALVRRNFTLNGEDSIMYKGELSQVQAIQNAAKATVYGIQLGFDVKLPQGFGVYSRFNYQHGEEELDDGTKSTLRHAAPWFGATHLTYHANKVDLDFYALYNGAVKYKDIPQEERSKAYMYAIDSEGNPYSPGWMTLNFKALYNAGNGLMLTAGVENILDLRYRPYSSGIVAPGRNFVLSLRARF